MNAAQELSLRLSTPDVLTAMPWTLNGQSTEKFERFKQFLATKSLRIPKRPIALRGGRMLAPDKGLVDEKTGEHLALERSLAVIPAIAGDGQQLNRVIHYPTEQKDMKRDAMKELRGLAMHVMYRCISETPWFVKEGKTEESLNLVKMTHEILQGKGIWEGVNKPMKK